MKIGQKASWTQAALIAAAALLAPAAAFAGPADAYYERAFVAAAHARCGLFQPDVERALNAAVAQARGAALRSGAAETELAAVAARARARAHSTSCADPQLATVRRRVDGAFSGWARTPRMTFPGDRSEWVADRAGYARSTWRLSQASIVGASPVTFGYAGKDGAAELTAVVSWHGRPRPYAARIVLRDPAVAQRAWLAGDGMGPLATRTGLWASGMAVADQTLLTRGLRSGDAWRFPATAAAALERLDPRETFAVEFHFRDGSVATAKFEAGDFAAGRAFLAMGSL